MQLENHSGIHLSYCTNVHPGHQWNDIYKQLKQFIPELKKRLSPDEPFGIGLRLSAKAADELLEPAILNEFREWLDEQGLYVFTINGFVYGSFHHEKVKDEVYKPDWGSQERFHYTAAVIDILKELTPAGEEGSLSTSPVTYKYWDASEDEKNSIIEKSCQQMARLAYKMAEILKQENKLLHVDIEPEPDCFLENSAETIHFFQHHLLPAGSRYLAGHFEVSVDESEEIIRNHIRVCYDTCHFALEYEQPAAAISAFEEAGIKIGKVQLSSALKVQLGSDPLQRGKIAKQLEQFIEPVYLHQVLAKKRDGNIVQFRDLDDALANISDPDMQEWRVHFHVPVFMQQYERLASTQDETIKSLQILLGGKHSTHFEVETYTWEVLPEELKMELTDSIERELRWAAGEIRNYSELSHSDENPESQ